ncbi:hypothetical protein GCM10023195_15710 [Actinoallomurus liliacearum]|uniref:HTH gntR-type domain-containing protein n=1 Tax=Actinoallomurus liliacearum TaxID=1080073 RepID=A0ABP8TGM1_9ACTN
MEPDELVERLGRWSAGRGPLYVLLAARLRRLIDDGELPSDTRLPPERAFAAALAVGRNTVVAAYELLRTEGRIVRRQGSGTRVAGFAPSAPPGTTGAPVFLHLLEPRDGVILLACAAPDSPLPELAAAYGGIAPALAEISGDIGYHPAGNLGLRRAVAERYARRGASTEPEQILVTNGGQQALSLLARAFVRPGDRVLVEAPTYPGAFEALRDEAAVPRTLPPGLDGLEAAVREHRLPAQLAAELLPHLDTVVRRRAAERRVRHDHLRAELARRLPSWEAQPVRGGQTLRIRLPYGDGASFRRPAGGGPHGGHDLSLM